jgi:tripartite-type tricarboxylate transporter receptor subunit TctC
VDGVAHSLHLAGLRQGDRVAIWLPSRIESVIIFLACSRNGYVCCPSLHQSYTAKEVIALLNRIRCKAFFSMRGAIGAQFTARAAPDGKTLMVGSVSEVGINPGLYPKLPYNVERDFVPVTALAAAPMVLVVSPTSSIKTAADLVSQAKASPGKINFGSAGTGSGAHMAAELFMYATGIRLTHVPYKGTGAVAADMLGSQKDMVLFAPLPSIAGLVRGGQLKAIAVTGKQRSPAMTEVPTFTEAGIPGYEMDYWYGLIAPAGTPEDVRHKIHQATLDVLSQPEVIANLAKQGLVTTITTEADFAAFVKADMAKWAAVVKAAQIKVEE